MIRWKRMLAWVGMVLASLMLVTAGGLMYANRHTPKPAVNTLEASLASAIGWMTSHRDVLLDEPNPGLWWMMRTAAEITADSRLRELVAASQSRAFPPDVAPSVWLRMWQPDAAIEVPAIQHEQMADYQEGIVSALSCGETERKWHHSPAWRQSHQCGPWWRGLSGLDRWCATHQLMVLKLIRDQGCPASMAPDPALMAALRSDILQLLRTDPTMKDASLQRVLMLVWTQGVDAVPAVWLHRVLDSQRADGGWMGNTQIMWLPDALQVIRLRNWVSRYLPIERDEEITTFHPSAQGLLIVALALDAAKREASTQRTSQPGH